MSTEIPEAVSGAHGHNGGARLVAMANDIGHYFRPQGREAAIAGIASHLERFWTPRMRAKLNAFLAGGGGGAEELGELPHAALERLNAQDAAKRQAG
jgi:formate dehydrogenase subunit delta